MLVGLFVFKILFISLTERTRERKQGGAAEGEGEAGSSLSRDPEGLWDHDLSQRQMLN